MALLLSVLLFVALFALFELLIPPRPAWSRVVAHGTPPEPAAPRVPDLGGLLSREAVQRRLAALSEELVRLDEDRSIFARAFRTYVVQDAYRALLADASRLAKVQTLDLGGVTVDEGAPAARGRAEVLEL
ncbi:MAG: hypothetical protein HY830_15450 [Actinobacteria bacterium]|nr:hypothetical protein [Actinomycetota bacterium]